jgi:hypothetical protein
MRVAVGWDGVLGYLPCHGRTLLHDAIHTRAVFELIFTLRVQHMTVVVWC